MATDKTPSSKHGRLHEEEAKREFMISDERKAELDRQGEQIQKRRDEREAAQKPVAPMTAGFTKALQDDLRPTKTEKKPEPVRLNGPMLLPDVAAALSDRYPHNTILNTVDGKQVCVAVPTGHIYLDIAAVNKCKNTAELRAYIDALPIL